MLYLDQVQRLETWLLAKLIDNNLAKKLIQLGIIVCSIWSFLVVGGIVVFLLNLFLFYVALCYICNVIQIKDPIEFFELIVETNSTIKCTADGLTINNNIDISPLAYNMIGVAAFENSINQLKLICMPNIVHKSFGAYVPKDRQKEFLERLKQAKQLPVANQKEEVKKIIKEFSTDDLDEKKFDKLWEKAEVQRNRKIEKVFKDFSEGNNSENHTNKADFEELKSLYKKKLSGESLTQEEQLRLDEQRKKCTRHRKGYFFESSQGNPQTSDENKEFKKLIDTFTNGRNERLCYRINVEEVKQQLVEMTAVTNAKQLKEVEVNGKKIFANMKTRDYDRLNRVLANKNNKKDLFKAALQVANDENFKGLDLVKSPNDVASIIEAIACETVIRIHHFNEEQFSLLYLPA
jgi:hypothetical protein